MQNILVLQRGAGAGPVIREWLGSKGAKVREWLDSRSGFFTTISGFTVTRRLAVLCNAAFLLLTAAAAAAEYSAAVSAVAGGGRGGLRMGRERYQERRQAMMDSSAFEAVIGRMRVEHRKTLDANASMLADARKELADERRQHVMVINSIRLARQRTVDGCRKVIYGRQADIDNAINKATGELEAEQARYGARVKELEARLSELEDNRKRELCEYNARVMNMAGIGINQEGGEA